jgi:hypothetical protein
MKKKKKRHRELLGRKPKARGKRDDPREARPLETAPPSHTPAPAPAAPGLQAAATAAANPVPGNTPWPPGTSGNPDGYSRGRRYSDSMNAFVLEMKAGRRLNAVWLEKLFKGDPKFWQLLLKHCQDQASKDRDPIDPAAALIAPVIDTTDPLIDAATITRMLEAADPTTIPILEEDDAP